MKLSAGILLYRRKGKTLQVFLVHPGGPFWKNKDAGAWTIPKGEFEPDENPLHAAIREFNEETGLSIEGNFIELVAVKQRSGKIVYAWALEADPDLSRLTSNTFALEWPPGSGKKIKVPEVDKWEWLNIPEAKGKINPAQVALIDDLVEKLNRKSAK